MRKQNAATSPKIGFAVHFAKRGFMKKHLAMFLVLTISILAVSSAFVQDKQKIPADFFMGKWGGTISGKVVILDPSDEPVYFP